MNNFQRIKKMLASVETTEELYRVLGTLSIEQQRACEYNIKIGNCDKNHCLCKQHVFDPCCMCGMTEYLKADTVESVECAGKWDFIKSLNIGDTFEVVLNNNRTAIFQKVHVKNGVSYVVLHHLWDMWHYINTRDTNVGGFPTSRINHILNEAILYELPEDLVEAILPRKITQSVDGVEYTTICKLWLPSMIELFGTEDSKMVHRGVERDNEQFEWYKKGGGERQVKERRGLKSHWWTRTPAVEDLTNFYVVTTNTLVNPFCFSFPADCSSGIAFGFCIM